MSKLGYMRDTFPIRANLEEDRILHPPTEMNRDPQSIRHDHQIGEDASAAEEHIPVTSDKLYRTETPDKRLERGIQCREGRWPSAKHLRPMTRAARVPLIPARETSFALGTGPRCAHGGPDDIAFSGERRRVRSNGEGVGHSGEEVA